MEEEKKTRRKGDKSFTPMENGIHKRVGESSTQRSRPKSNKAKLLAESPAPSSSSKKRNRRKKKADSEKYYTLGNPGILDQKEENGKVYYLCNWADDPETGESYPATWEPYDFVTLDEIANWQSRRWQGRRLEQDQREQECVERTEHRGTIRSTQDSLEDSQPPRPAKRRRITHGPNPTSEEQTPIKKPRRVGTVNSARFQSVSQESIDQEELPNEIKDSYEEDQQLSPSGGKEARVEIPIHDDFDREAYSKVVTSSQLSQPSQPSNPSQISQSPIPSSQFQTPAARHKYSSTIWDEDIEGVIPDSQEQPGLSSYKPSETPISKTATSSRQNTGTDIEEVELSSTQTASSHRGSRASGIVQSDFAEHIDNFTQASYRNSAPNSSSIQTESSEAHSSSNPLPLSQESQENQTQDIEYSSGLVDNTVPSVDFSVQSRRESSLPDFRTPSDSSLRLRVTRSQERAPTLHAQPGQTLEPEIPESSSLGFATQLPLRSDGDDDIRQSPDVSIERNHPKEDPLRQPNLSLEELADGSQTLREGSYQQQSFPPNQRSAPSFEATWHTAREISSTSRPSQASPEAPATPVQTPREGDLVDSSPEKNPKTPDAVAKPSVPGLSVDTQRLPSKSRNLSSEKWSAEQRSQESSGSLPSPPFESAGSAVERFAQLTSQNRPRTPPEQVPGSGSVGISDENHPSESLGSSVAELTCQEQPSTPPQSACTDQLIENLQAQLREQSVQSISPIHQSTPIKFECAAQTIEDSGRNSSPRAPVIIDLTMDDPPVNPVLAKLQLRKAEAAAKRAAERAASASRSLPQSPAPLSPAPAAGSVNEQAVAPNQTLPLHGTIEDIALPPFERITSPKASPEAEPEVEATPTGLRIIPQSREEYAVPLPMVAYARDVYVDAIRVRRSQRYAFLTDEVFDASLVKEIDSMIDDLDSLCNHQDLIADDFSTQKMESVERQAKWAENVSTKCIFLAEFLSAMQTEDKQIAVLVRPGRMQEILEALFQWRGFVYNRCDQPDQPYYGNTAGGPMRINLYPTQGEILGFSPPSIVIAFDSTYTSKPDLIKHLRAGGVDPNRVIPLLPLIVTHSIEHLEKCFDASLEPIERKIKLVSCLTQIGDGVGKLSAEHYIPPAAAKAVAEYVVNGSIEGTWPLLPMPDIEDLDLNIESSQPEQRPSGSALKTHDVSLSQALQLGSKRELEIGDATNSDSPKRQKLTPVPGEQEPFQISDTVLHSSSGNLSSTSAGVNEIIAKTAAIDDEQENQVSMLLKKVNDLEIQLRSREANESELRQINQDLETRCQDYESSIASIQPKYQEALNDRGEFEHEINLARLRQTHLQKDLANKDAEVTKLREQKAALDAELTSARTALSSSSIPEIAEMGKLKEELANERSEKERLQKRLTNMQGDLEYMRNNYQNSSTLAAEHANENQALRTEVAELREKAKENIVQIHETQKSGEIEEYVRRIRELKEENGELERELDRKSEELRTLMNGRRATRGTSVPRSPRMGTGGTMSPNPRPMGRAAMQMGGIGMAMGGVVGGGNGSRGNSPVPGELGGFRGTGTFVGEALFQGGGPRWGNHLQ